MTTNGTLVTIATLHLEIIVFLVALIVINTTTRLRWQKYMTKMTSWATFMKEMLVTVVTQPVQISQNENE